jgi:hypothetical protein
MALNVEGSHFGIADFDALVAEALVDVASDDAVPFAAAGRQMGDGYPETGFVGKVLQFTFPEADAGAVAAAAIGRYGQGSSLELGISVGVVGSLAGLAVSLTAILGSVRISV